LYYLFGFVHHFVEVMQFVIGYAYCAAYQGVGPASAFAFPLCTLTQPTEKVQSQPIQKLIEEHLLGSIP
jgi:hypothetical protein